MVYPEGRFEGSEGSICHPCRHTGLPAAKVRCLCSKGYDAAGRKCTCGLEYPVGGHGFHPDIPGVVEVEAGKVYAPVLGIVHQHPVHAYGGVVGTESAYGNGFHPSNPSVILDIQSGKGTQHLVQVHSAGTVYRGTSYLDDRGSCIESLPPLAPVGNLRCLQGINLNPVRAGRLVQVKRSCRQGSGQQY